MPLGNFVQNRELQYLEKYAMLSGFQIRCEAKQFSSLFPG